MAVGPLVHYPVIPLKQAFFQFPHWWNGDNFSCLSVIVEATKGFPGSSAGKKLPAMQETLVQFLGREDHLEKGIATHSSLPAWRTPWIEETGRLLSIRSQRVGHNRKTFTFIVLLWNSKQSTQQRACCLPRAPIQMNRYWFGSMRNMALAQEFSVRVIPTQGKFGNVWRHFWWSWMVWGESRATGT